VNGRAARLHELTAVPGIHLLLERDAGPGALGEDPTLRVVAGRGSLLHLHRLDSHPGRGVVAVRPDGYVGFRCGEPDPAQLGAWLRLVGALPPS
jgi:hypothetical protein